MPLVFPVVPRPRVSIVMVTYGGWEWVRRSLEAILANTEACYELIVVDNASPDGLAERLEQEAVNVRIVRNDVNRGFGCANNQAAALAIGQVLAFVNSDAFVHPGWLAPLLERFDAEPSAAAVAPRLLNLDGSLQEAGSVVFENGSTQFVGFGDDPERAEYRFPRVVDYASAACLLVRRRDFFEVGGFDAVYAPGYFEDADLCLALKSRGRRTLYEPRSTVTHVRGASWREAGIAHWTRNAPVFAQRWARLLSTRPGFASADGPLRRRIAARDAPASARILVAADGPPNPSGSATDRRVAWLSTELVRLYPDARVTLLHTSDPAGFGEGERLIARGIEVSSAKDRHSWLRARRLHYDVVVLAGETAIDCLEALTATQPQAFLVADAAAFPEGIARSGRSSRRRKSTARELDALTSADVVLVSSFSDVSWVRTVRSPETCFLLPAPLDAETTPSGFWSREKLVFVASEDPAGAADENALAYLSERILPLVKRDDPQAEITIVATLSAEQRRRFERDDVRVLAAAPALLDSARVLIAPFPRRPPNAEFLLRAGLLGLPYVATSEAASGLPFENLPADALAVTARGFAEKVLALYRDEVRWTRLQRALRRKTLRSLDPDSLAETFVRAFARVGLAPPGPASIGSRRATSRSR